MKTRTLAQALLTTLLAGVLVTAPMWAHAQVQPQKPANEQVIVPEVERRDVKLPRFPSKDFEFGILGGMYATENFGTSPVVGLKAGYHITEDVFVEGRYARTTVTDEAFRRVLPGGIFADEKETLTYYSLSAGYNVLPGEVFIGTRRAKATAIYLIAGVGSTKFVEQRRQTLNFGFGLRLLLADRWAINVDMRDHIYSLDLLGKRDTTQNLEMSAGLSFFF
jgi:outer membrane beta-barrel protein